VFGVKDNGAQGGAIEGTVWKKQMLPPECTHHVLEALRPWKVDFVTDNVLWSGIRVRVGVSVKVRVRVWV
jgi:hypothetical protein